VNPLLEQITIDPKFAAVNPAKRGTSGGGCVRIGGLVERERGISVSSAVMSFEHQGLASNLLDTPGDRPVVAIAAGSILLCYRSG
jgi:hypothetical protein